MGLQRHRFPPDNVRGTMPPAASLIGPRPPVRTRMVRTRTPGTSRLGAAQPSPAQLDPDRNPGQQGIHRIPE
ncbi:MAG: hypothetical protein ACYC61_26915, partial [Isosphaeraceae bacterium]